MFKHTNVFDIGLCAPFPPLTLLQSLIHSVPWPQVANHSEPAVRAVGRWPLWAVAGINVSLQMGHVKQANTSPLISCHGRLSPLRGNGRVVLATPGQLDFCCAVPAADLGAAGL